MSVAWFERRDPESGEAGLRFACTMCGNCCSGAPGVVLFTDDEAAALALHLGLTVEAFLATYTQETSEGRSLVERRTQHGYDCVFLDRESRPGRALCGVYEYRPMQCRTWPFWKRTLRDREAWLRSKRMCPGIDTGPLHSPRVVRLTRDRSPL